MNTVNPSFLKRQENLLSAWKQECDALSSPLHVRPMYERAIVDSVYQTLERFFDLKYFAAHPVDIPLEKTLWLHYLLVNPKDAGSFLALVDIARLTLYAIALGPSFAQTLKALKKNPDNLRSYYFELYTYRLLDQNNIPNIKKPIVGAQELEGFCTLLSKEYIFECRKLYLPGLKELDIRQTMLLELQKQSPQLGNKAQTGMGIIVTLKLANATDKQNKQIFRQRISEFIKQSNAHEGYATIDYNHTDEYGTLQIENYSVRRALELEQENTCDVYVIIYPATFPVQGQSVHHRVKGNINHSMPREKITTKLISVLKEKRRQHKGSTQRGKIYFFDNEILPEFRMALFTQDAMLDTARLQAFMDKCEDDEGLCIITRNHLGGKAMNSMQVFCNPANHALKSALEALVLP